MGLRDKIAAKMASFGIDHAAILTAELGPEEPLVACAGMYPAAYERRGGAVGLDPSARLLSKALDAASNVAAKSKHIGGEEGSIARGLSRDGDLVYAALSPQGLSLWNFGPTGQHTPPTLEQRLSGDQIRSVVDTGKRAQGGTMVVRFTFVDDSFFDFRAMPGSQDFLAACAQRWPA